MKKLFLFMIISLFFMAQALALSLNDDFCKAYMNSDYYECSSIIKSSRDIAYLQEINKWLDIGFVNKQAIKLKKEISNRIIDLNLMSNKNSLLSDLKSLYQVDDVKFFLNIEKQLIDFQNEINDVLDVAKKNIVNNIKDNFIRFYKKNKIHKAIRCMESLLDLDPEATDIFDLNLLKDFLNNSNVMMSKYSRNLLEERVALLDLSNSLPSVFSYINNGRSNNVKLAKECIHQLSPRKYYFVHEENDEIRYTIIGKLLKTIIPLSKNLKKETDKVLFSQIFDVFIFALTYSELLTEHMEFIIPTKSLTELQLISGINLEYKDWLTLETAIKRKIVVANISMLRKLKVHIHDILMSLDPSNIARDLTDKAGNVKFFEKLYDFVKQSLRTKLSQSSNFSDVIVKQKSEKIILKKSKKEDKKNNNNSSRKIIIQTRERSNSGPGAFIKER